MALRESAMREALREGEESLKLLRAAVEEISTSDLPPPSSVVAMRRAASRAVR